MMNSLATVDVRPYQGVAFSTARIYAPYLDMDEEDVAQELLLKAAQALVAYRPRRVVRTLRTDGRSPEQAWVFMCIKNRVKDLLKAQQRRRLPDGGRRMYYIEDVRGDEPTTNGTTKWDAEHMSITHAEVYAEVEDVEVPLPPSLTKLEAAVVRLLIMELSQTEIARVLDVPRRRVRVAYVQVQEKMVDFKPSPAASR
jgi:RNA polymerase sigma factor (sigma-70 family)